MAAVGEELVDKNVVVREPDALVVVVALTVIE